jgi:hypothetical protein
MKMMQGACFLPCSNRSRTRLRRRRRTSPRSRNLRSRRTATPASPATRLASRVLPVPGRADQQHALGDAAAQFGEPLRVLRNWMISSSSYLGLSTPATSLNVTSSRLGEHPGLLRPKLMARPPRSGSGDGGRKRTRRAGSWEATRSGSAARAASRAQLLYSMTVPTLVQKLEGLTRCRGTGR